MSLGAAGLKPRDSGFAGVGFQGEGLRSGL